MSSPSPAASQALSERLQRVTEALAAARRQDEVFAVVMEAALGALEAVAGAVLLVSADGAWLTLAAAQGQASGQTLWQDGPLNREVPGGDALLRREALFFEHEGALVRAYPHLEARTGGVAAVATAVLPMVLDGRPLGTLILDFQEPHEFTREEERFLRTLAAQCALALGRARLLVSLQEELAQHRQTEQDLRRSEARFRRVVEASPVAIAAGDLSGRLMLVNDAYLNMLEYTRAEFEAGEIDWAGLTPPEFQAADERAFAQALERGAAEPYEKEMRTRSGERLPLQVVLLRYEDGEQPLVVGYLQDLRQRRAAEGMLRAHSAQLEAQVEARTRESEAARVRAEVLAALGDALQGATTPEEVAAHALQTLGPALRAQSMLMVGLDGPGIRLPTLWGQLPEVIARYMTRPGLRLDEAPMLERVAQAGQGLYFDNYRAEPGTVASFPPLAVGVEPIHLPGGSLAGFLVVWRLPQEGAWADVERDLLRRAAGTLGLALERAEQARQLQARQDEQARRAQALTAFAELSRDLTLETDPYILIQRTQQVVLSLLPPGFSSYFELSGRTWQLRTQVGRADLPSVQAALEEGLPYETPHLLRPWRSGEAHYENGIDPASGHGGGPLRPGATVTLPVHVGAEVRGILAFALVTERHWSGEDRAVLETVGRQLTLALERAETTRQLAEQNAELGARTRALEGFANLTRDLGLEDDPYTLVRRAQQVVLSLLPDGYAVYYEPEGSRWVLRAQTGEVRNEALQAVADAGLPYEEAGNLLTPYTSLAPYYQDQYAQDTDNLVSEVVAHLGASATLPVLVGGRPRGVFAVVLFGRMRPWAGAERAVMETVVRSLGLALERTQGVADLARRTQELARSNAELEQFAYVASHDLQAPIRAVTSFAGIIERRYGAALDDRGQLYLRQIRESGEHMKRLLDDLLAYSRVHTERRTLRPTDVAAVFDAVASRLEASESAGVRITRGALPVVLSDAQQLDQLLQNLMANGLKYRREGVTPQVHVTATLQDRFWCFAVQDNGIGIEPEYRERIFVIFQRLHGRETYEGTGIGLAVCKKIVELHGGELWVDSTPGEGSTFFFTLPAA
ncbi:GAF domain-containing protein [Deinococcus hohokamensis]|uniref:histidine kinase n=1 Tax=Deinococcus hohokamensis TaxID=309883 RepID=A0ABV9I6V5_9DEIO